MPRVIHIYSRLNRRTTKTVKKYASVNATNRMENHYAQQRTELKTSLFNLI